MRRKRLSAASRKTIANYWIAHDPVWLQRVFAGELPSVQEASSVCWACKIETSSLERCHIIPHEFGGSHLASNLVLLCAGCHHEAPSVAFSSAPMMLWIAEHETGGDTIMDDVAGVMKSVPLVDLQRISAFPIGQQILANCYEFLMRRAGLHQGKFSAATRKAAVREAVEMTVSAVALLTMCNPGTADKAA